MTEQDLWMKRSSTRLAVRTRVKTVADVWINYKVRLAAGSTGTIIDVIDYVSNIDPSHMVPRFCYDIEMDYFPFMILRLDCVSVDPVSTYTAAGGA